MIRKIRAGAYETKDGVYYIVREQHNRPAYWMVGERVDGQAEHLTDFRTYKEARQYVLWLKEVSA